MFNLQAVKIVSLFTSATLVLACCNNGNESKSISKRNLNNSAYNPGVNNSTNLKNEVEKEIKLNRAKNLYDLNILNSSEFENSKIN